MSACPCRHLPALHDLASRLDHALSVGLQAALRRTSWTTLGVEGIAEVLLEDTPWADPQTPGLSALRGWTRDLRLQLAEHFNRQALPYEAVQVSTGEGNDWEWAVPAWHLGPGDLPFEPIGGERFLLLSDEATFALVRRYYIDDNYQGASEALMRKHRGLFDRVHDVLLFERQDLSPAQALEIVRANYAQLSAEAAAAEVGALEVEEGEFDGASVVYHLGPSARPLTTSGDRYLLKLDGQWATARLYLADHAWDGLRGAARERWLKPADFAARRDVLVWDKDLTRRDAARLLRRAYASTSRSSSSSSSSSSSTRPRARPRS